MSSLSFAQAILVLLLVLLLAVCWRSSAARRETFVSARARATCDAAVQLFGRRGTAVSYQAFRAAVPETDPVVFADVRRLWQEDRLRPETVQAVL